MIRPCTESDIPDMLAVINDAATAYRGVIPADRWQEPYMPEAELRHEIGSGVVFHGWDENRHIIGLMGIQDVQDVALIRHAYVSTARRRRGIGSRLLDHLRGLTPRPTLVGTWTAAVWAIRFYEQHGYRQVTREETHRLLRAYWSLPERQVETSVVLADASWFSLAGRPRVPSNERSRP